MSSYSNAAEIGTEHAWDIQQGRAFAGDDRLARWLEKVDQLQLWKIRCWAIDRSHCGPPKRSAAIQ
jgi:hypothetical protein